MGTAYLILENGAVFRGETFGCEREAVGELVFTTGMAGYMETLSDPCFSGQIVLQTFPLIGNYGVIPAEFEGGTIQLKAYIVREWCQEPSNFRSEGELDTFLRDNGIPGLCGVDTRAITRVLRDNGTMNAMLSKTPELTAEQWSELRGYKAIRAEGEASGQTVEAACDEAKYNVALWDLGKTRELARELSKLGCDVTIFPYGTAAEEIRALCPDGLVLSEGPGDPADNTRIVNELKKLLKTPVFGVGLGHQILAIACGARIIKLPFGHRGANQPVQEIKSGRYLVTTQNHGYAVAPDTLPKGAEMSYVNCNDGTCEGVEYSKIQAFSVQFKPEPEVLGRFLEMMEGGRGQCR